MNNTQFDGDELLALARLDVEASRLDAALTKIKQGFELKDTPIDLFALGARLYAQLRLYARAKTLYSTYLKERPDQVTELFQLGMVNFDSGDRQEALAIWKDLLKSHPTHPPTLYFSSALLAELGEIESAIRNLNVLIQSAPANNLYFERGKELLSSINKKEGQSLQSQSPNFAYGTEN